MPQQNITLDETMIQWYDERWKNARQGITAAVVRFQSELDEHPVPTMFSDIETAHHFMIQTWKQMWRHSLASLKGVFTAGELSLFIDTHNGLILSPWHYGSNTLAVGTSDSIALDGTAEKWDVDPETIIDKIKSLTPAQALCVEIWACGFWVQMDDTLEDSGFSEYINQLS